MATQNSYQSSVQNNYFYEETVDKLNFTQQTTVKPVFFRVPFISRAWQVRENNGLRKFEYSSISV